LHFLSYIVDLSTYQLSIMPFPERMTTHHKHLDYKALNGGSDDEAISED
jgi:hypothetical protein